MPFIYLLLLALICLETDWRKPPDGLTPTTCAILVGVMVLAAWLAAELIARTIAWQMTHHTQQLSSLFRRYARWRRYHFFALLIVYLLTLYWLGWGHVVKIVCWRETIPELLHLDISTPIPGIEIGLLAPFYAALLLAWNSFYRIERTIYELSHAPDRFMSRLAYLLLQVRHQLLLVMPPLLLLLALQFLLAFFPELDETSYVSALVVTVLMAGTFVLMPFLLRLFLGLKPLPPGLLRDRLEETARRLRFRYSNVLIWNTRNLFANALVTGFIPWLRYIVLTDRLIDELAPEEIEAVFGHEIGHIKYHHLLFYLAFFLSSLILLGLFWESIKEWVERGALNDIPYIGSQVRTALESLGSVAKLTLLAVYTLLVFGFISRRCERQADLCGASTVSVDVFINALEKVAQINGIPRDRGGNWLVSWQHPTIAQRIAFLQEMRDNPARIPTFHRSILLMEWTSFLTLGGLLWCHELPKIVLLVKDF